MASTKIGFASNESVAMSYIAGADLSGKLGYIVKADSTDGQEVLSTASTDDFGVLADDAAESGDPCSVVMQGKCLVKLGANLVAGAKFKPGASGTAATAIAATAGAGYMGIILRGGSAGDLVEALVERGMVPA